MRSLEIALVIGCLPILGIGLLGCRVLRLIAIALLLLPAAILIVHVAVDGLRPPVILVYLVAVLLGCGGLIWLFLQNLYFPPSVIKTGAICLLVLLLGGGFLAWLYPAFVLPLPKGAHPVGTVTLQLDNIGRKLTLRIWYPATANSGDRRASYLPPGQVSRFEWFSGVRTARANALENADLSGNGLSLILYSPLWEGGSFQNTTLFEALASEGFVVAAIELPKDSQSPPPLDFSTEEGWQKFQNATQEQLEMRTSDILRVFGILEDMNSGVFGNGRFKGRLNLSSIGVMGYSFGGAVAAEALLREPRLRSGINFDGTLFGKVDRPRAGRPFLFITDKEPMPPESSLKSSDLAIRRSAEFSAFGLRQVDQWLKIHGGRLVQFEGVPHAAFSDIPLYGSRRPFDQTLREKAKDTLQKINFFAVVFFDETLRGKPAAILEKDSTPWPGVEIREATFQ